MWSFKYLGGMCARMCVSPCGGQKITLSVLPPHCLPFCFEYRVSHWSATPHIGELAWLASLKDPIRAWVLVKTWILGLKSCLPACKASTLQAELSP